MQKRVFEGVGTYLSHSWQIFRRESEIRRFLFANAAWEGVFAAARTFVVLYVIKGLGESKAISSAILGAVGLGYVLAAIVASRLGDRFGLARVIVIASFFYGGGFLVAGLAEKWHAWYLGFIVPVAFAGGLVMTLAWGLLFKLTPARASWGRLRPGDHDQGDRAAARSAARGAGHRPHRPLLPEDGRVPVAVVPLRARHSRRDPARRLADPAGGGASATRSRRRPDAAEVQHLPRRARGRGRAVPPARLCQAQRGGRTRRSAAT